MQQHADGGRRTWRTDRPPNARLVARRTSPTEVATPGTMPQGDETGRRFACVPRLLAGRLRRTRHSWEGVRVRSKLGVIVLGIGRFPADPRRAVALLRLPQGQRSSRSTRSLPLTRSSTTPRTRRRSRRRPTPTIFSLAEGGVKITTDLMSTREHDRPGRRGAGARTTRPARTSPSTTRSRTTEPTARTGSCPARSTG